MIVGKDRRTKTIVTLVGVGQARVGELFVHKGPSVKCAECRYFNVCVKNLEDGRLYKIVGLRNRVLRCEVHEVDMRVVDVIEADILAAVPSKQAIKGVLLTFYSQKCEKQDCSNYDLCSPEYLRDNDRCEVIEVYGSVSCPKGLQLAKALLRRAPPS